MFYKRKNILKNNNKENMQTYPCFGTPLRFLTCSYIGTMIEVSWNFLATLQDWQCDKHQLHVSMPSNLL